MNVKTSGVVVAMFVLFWGLGCDELERSSTRAPDRPYGFVPGRSGSSGSGDNKLTANGRFHQGRDYGSSHAGTGLVVGRPTSQSPVKAFEVWSSEGTGLVNPDEEEANPEKGSAGAYYREGLPEGWFVYAGVSGSANDYWVAVTVPRDHDGRWAGDLHIRIDGQDHRVDAGWLDIRTDQGDEIRVYESGEPIPLWLSQPIRAETTLKMRVAQDTDTLIGGKDAHAVHRAMRSGLVWGKGQLPAARARALEIEDERIAQRDRELWGETDLAGDVSRSLDVASDQGSNLSPKEITKRWKRQGLTIEIPWKRSNFPNEDYTYIAQARKTVGRRGAAGFATEVTCQILGHDASQAHTVSVGLELWNKSYSDQGMEAAVEAIHGIFGDASGDAVVPEQVIEAFRKLNNFELGLWVVKDESTEKLTEIRCYYRP